MTATSNYYYDLPPESIAQEAVEPRHAARLLDTRTMTEHRFVGLASLLEPGDLIVANRTRVRRARLVGRRPTGGRVEVLLLSARADGRWEALARPTRRLGAGSQILFGPVVAAVVGEPDEGRIVIEADVDLATVAEAEGTLPLPPYFSGVLADPERYQTMFADRVGSAAAPTAGLHFTPEVIRSLAERDIAVALVELKVGVDTFRPIAVDDLDDHRMHSENVTVEESVVETVAQTQRAGGRVVAVGTTVVRALESAAADGTLRPMAGPTSLFIRPGHRFEVVDLAITNFHVPGSTLIVLVAAMLGERWRDVYAHAIERGFRFLSFGDAMLVEVPR